MCPWPPPRHLRGPKYSVSALKRLHTVAPVRLGFLCSRQWNWHPFHCSSTGSPRCSRYQAPSLAGSFALKKTPPIPVTICFMSQELLVIPYEGVRPPSIRPPISPFQLRVR